MALAQNRLVAGVWSKLRTKIGRRFTRFVGAAGAALAATEIALTICNAAFHMTATPAALVSWFAGAVVSYVLSRWAWERKGRPDVLRETLPFWVISAMVIVILTLANHFGYHSAAWLHLKGVKHVLWVDFIWLVANFGTFLLRFLVFHFVLFTDRTTAARAAATGPDAVPPGTRTAPAPAEVRATVTAEASAPAGASAQEQRPAADGKKSPGRAAKPADAGKP